MPFKVTPPKYVVIFSALQERIESGMYPPGAVLPSEAMLTKEFQAARPTVVRALEYLRQQGWIESRQGRGRFVLGKPASTVGRAPGHGYAFLEADETGAVTLLAAGSAPAPRRAAETLGVPRGAAIVVRRRLLTLDSGVPIELGTIYAPASVAAVTDLGTPHPMTEGLLTHLRRRASIDLDHATERIAARLPSAEESRLLKVAARECLLTVLLGVRTRTGQPLVAVEILLPAARRCLDGILPLR